jgi:hypothetical protein
MLLHQKQHLHGTEKLGLNQRDRVLIAPARNVTRHATIIITGALFAALAVCAGWIAGTNSDFPAKPASLPVKTSADRPDAARSD